MADGLGDIFVGLDDFRKFSADSFLQNANRLIGDVWTQHTIDNIPQMAGDIWTQHVTNQLPNLTSMLAPPAAPSQSPVAAPSDPFAPITSPSPTPTTPTAPAPFPGADSGSPPPAPPPAPAAGVPGPVTETTAGLSGGGQGTGNMTDRAQGILAGGAQAASWLGDQGQKALQAVLVTEGGLNNARGDSGKSAGPLQFYEGGQLANLAQQLGMSLEQAKGWVEQNPVEAIKWAIGTPDKPGYLGGAIQRGLQAGLQGADLATYAQRHGQVSVSPERAGANFNALFSGGQDVLGGAGQAVQSLTSTVGGAVQQAGQAVQQSANGILDKVKPFLGNAYVWGGKGPDQGFDCSGLAGFLTTGQAESTTTLYGKSAGITQDSAQPGDLVFWNMGSSDPHMQHVAVYLGDGKIVQSGGNQAAVNVGSVNQQIGSAPEFRRMGPGGAPAQAQAAPPGAPDPATPPTSNPAAASTSPFGQQAASTGQLQSLWDRLGGGISDVFKNVFGGLGNSGAAQSQPGVGPSSNVPGGIPPPEGGGFGAVPLGGQNPLPDVFASIGQAAQTGLRNVAAMHGAANAVSLPPASFTTEPLAPGQQPEPTSTQLLNTVRSQNFPSILEPNHPLNVLDELSQKYASPADPFNLRIRDRMPPEDQAKWDSLATQVGGVEMPTLPGGTGGSNAARDQANAADRAFAEFAQEAGLNLKAQVSGVELPPLPGGEFAQKAGNINLAKFPTEVQDVIQATAPTIPEAATRGVVSDAVVRDLAQKAGTTVQDVVAKWQPGQAQNAETLYALRDALANQGRSVLDAQQALRSNPGSADAQAALVQALTEHRAVQEVVQGTTAEAGRALRQFTQPVTGDIAALQQLQTLAAKTGQAPADLAQRLATMDLSDPVHMGDIAKALNPPRLPPNTELLGQSGPTPGQLPLGTQFGQELPTVAPISPTAQEARGTAARQPGQLGLGIGEQFQQDLTAPSAGNFETPNVSTPAQTPEQADYLRRALTLKALREGTPLPDIPYQGPRGTNLQPNFDPSRAFDYDKLAQMRQDVESQQPQLGLNAKPKPNTVDKVISYTVNNMLSGVGTQVQNIMGNLSATVSRPLVTAGGGLTGDAGLFVDAARDVAAMGATFSEAFSRAGQTLKTGVRSGQPEQFATSAFAPQLRLLSAGDEFFRTLNAAGGQAAEVSRLLRENPGLSFEETLAKYQGRILAAGEDAAARSVYEKGGIGWGESIAQARSQLLHSDDPAKKTLGVILNAVVPFSKVPDTILTLGVRGLPGINEVYGIGKTVSLLRQGEVYAARREAGATALLTAANLGILAQALQGNITGDGPDDPTLLSQMMAARDQAGNALWRPHSVKLPDGRWIDYGFLGPMEIHMAAIANVVEGAREQGGSINPQPAQMAINRLTKTVGNLWYLRGLSDVLSAINGGQLATPNVANSIEAIGDRFVWQGSLLNEIRQLTDPTVRDPQNPLAREANRIPGLEALVPARPDPTTGQPLQRPQDVLSIMSRGSPPGMSPGSGSAEILSRSDVAVSPAPKQITVGKFPIQLTHDEQQQYTQLRGQLIDQMVAPLARDNAFQTAPLYVREQVLRKMLDQASSAANKMLIGQLDPNSLNQRLQQSQQTITTNTPFLPEDTSSAGRVPALAR